MTGSWWKAKESRWASSWDKTLLPCLPHLCDNSVICLGSQGEKGWERWKTRFNKDEEMKSRRQRKTTMQKTTIWSLKSTNVQMQTSPNLAARSFASKCLELSGAQQNFFASQFLHTSPRHFRKGSLQKSLRVLNHTILTLLNVTSECHMLLFHR